MKRGKPLKRTAMKPTRKALPKQSARRKSEVPERRRVNALVVERDGGCVPKMRGMPGDCLGPLAAHELVKRSAGGDYLDPENCVAACSYHNGRIEDYPNEARGLGLVLRKPPKEG